MGGGRFYFVVWLLVCGFVGEFYLFLRCVVVGMWYCRQIYCVLWLLV